MKHFLNKPFLLATLVSLALLLGCSTWLDSSLSSLVVDVRWLPVALMFFYCLFCWLGLSVLALGPVGWARTDYGWIGLAVLGLCVSQVSLFKPLHLTGVLLAAALALRLARSCGEIVLKARVGRTLWLIADGYLQIPAEDLLEIKLQRCKQRLGQVLKDWRTAGLPVVHVEVLGKQGPRPDPLPSTRLAVQPAFKECEFSFNAQHPLDSSELGRFLDRQPVDCLYLFGVHEPRLIERLQRWGKQRRVEVVVDEGFSVRVEALGAD